MLHKGHSPVIGKGQWHYRCWLGLRQLLGILELLTSRMGQARSQACLSEVANFHWRNHVVQNMRDYFILDVITTKCIKCTQEKTEFSCAKRPRLISTKILGDLFMAIKIKQQRKVARKFSGEAKDGILWPRGGSCHSMPLHSYGPGMGPSEDFKRQVFFILSRKEIKKGFRAF